MSKKIIIIIAVIALVVITGLWLNKSASSPSATVQSFLEALNKGDSATAKHHILEPERPMHEGTEDEITIERVVGIMISETKGNIEKVEILNEEILGKNTAEVKYRLTTNKAIQEIVGEEVENKTYEASFVLEKIDNKWKINIRS